jgi:hypothetical protein
MDFCGHFLTSISWSVSDQNLRPLSDAEAARKRHFVRQKANNRGVNIWPLVRQKANTRGVNQYLAARGVRIGLFWGRLSQPKLF